MVAGAGALCRYSKALLNSWLSQQYALGQLALAEVLGLSLLLFGKPLSQIFDNSSSRVRYIQLANQLLVCGHSFC